MSAPSPVDPLRRIASLDVLRGIALCGILFVNIPDMGGPIGMDRPLGSPSIADPDWLVWGFSQLFVTGTMRGLFSMLFGIGLLLFIGDDESADRSRLYLRRLMILFLFGVIDSTLLLWPGDILLIYAFAGAIALILHALKPHQQGAAAAVLLLMLSAWSAHEAAGIVPEQTVYTAKTLAFEGAERLGGYRDNLVYMSWVSWNWTVNALTYRWVADALAFMLVGMVLYRLGFFGPERSDRAIQRLALIGYAAGLALRLPHMLLIWHNHGAPTPLSGLIDQPGRLAMTLGHVGLFLLLWRRGGAGLPAMARLAAMGRMALTLYLGQSLIGATIFAGFGLGLWNQLSWPAMWLVAIAILAAEALFAAMWFSRFRYGPIEWLWRLGTYAARPK